MKDFLNKLRAGLFAQTPTAPTKDQPSNDSLVSIYHRMRDELKLIEPDEPNYALARKVFLDFNDFHLRNLEVNMLYLRFIPKSLLPYPKNYIKCAYYIFRHELRKAGDAADVEAIERIGSSLFLYYPEFSTYKESLKTKSMYDDVVFKDVNPSPRELFKKLYGAYQISEEEYNKSPSATDTSYEKLLHDFGVVPNIEDDV